MLPTSNVKSEPQDFSDTKNLLFENLDSEDNPSYDETDSKDGINLETANQNTIPNNLENYQCENCDESFPAIELYEVHKNVHSHNPIGDCPICNRSYKAAKAFYNHISDHIKNHIQCDYCPKIFFRKRSYTSHVAQHKKTDKIFTCSYCEKGFPTPKQIRSHERVHTNERPYQCDKCNKSFKQTGSLRTHMNTHMEEKMYTCQVCNGTFATTSSLKRHKKNIHATGRTMKCKLCEEEFLNLDSFSQHRMEKHPNVTRYFRICPICSEEFLSKPRYLSHRKIHKDKGELDDIKIMAESVKDEDGSAESKEVEINGSKRRRCALCGMLVEFHIYYIHQNVHLEMTVKEVMECEKTLKFKCKKCDVVNNTKLKAVRHMDSHLEKSYFCPVAGCVRRAPMTYYRFSKHRYNNHQIVKCRNCKKSFKGYLNFKRHRRLNPCKTVDKTPVARKKQRVYVCKWCSASFTNLQSIYLHYNAHKRLNIYQCQTCNKKFPRFNNFQKHMYVVHSEHVNSSNTSAYRVEYNQISDKNELKQRLYCSVCKEVFSSTKRLKDHENFHAKTKLQCKKCKKSFLRQSNYFYHVKNSLCSNWLSEAMLTEINDFKCTICETELSNLRNFARHMSNVHGEGEFHCKYCPSNYNSLEKFRGHLVSKHPNEKKYSCTLCSAPGFVTFREFIAHQRSHKRKKQIKQVLCKLTKDNLQKRNEFEVKQEIESEEEGETMDVPDIVTIDESGNIKEC